MVSRSALTKVNERSIMTMMMMIIIIIIPWLCVKICSFIRDFAISPHILFNMFRDEKRTGSYRNIQFEKRKDCSVIYRLFENVQAV